MCVLQDWTSSNRQLGYVVHDRYVAIEGRARGLDAGKATDSLDKVVEEVPYAGGEKCDACSIKVYE